MVSVIPSADHDSVIAFPGAALRITVGYGVHWLPSPDTETPRMKNFLEANATLALVVAAITFAILTAVLVQ
ncbi:MAG: hypothetical protein OXI37_09125 [Gammaproteobacteria bacterium]|nr:hypothetical protein [Gammaproteobacteria bacterium]